MSKVLLINPPFNVSKASYQTSINMGLLSLASYLAERGVEVKLIDCVRQSNFKELIKKELIAGGLDLVGLSVTIMQIDSALKLSEAVKCFDSQIPVVWGGAQPTLFPRQVVECPSIDVAVLGEGEEALLELVEGKDWHDISGIAFKDGDVAVNEKDGFLEELPVLNWSLMPAEVLENITLAPTCTSRGCPHQCAFCINSITKNRWRFSSAEKVLDDLEKLVQLPYFKGKPVRFWDEDFFVDMERAKKIIQGIIDRGLNIQWETTVRADYISPSRIDDEFLALLKKSGCYLLSFGGESGSEKILKKIDKGITPEQIINSARQTLKHGIVPQYSFMVGLPGETRDDIHRTIYLIDRLTDLSPEVQILGPQAFRPYPGSALYEECLTSGWVTPQTLKGWARVVQNELNYLSPRNFPWVKDIDLVESLEAYVRFGAHTIGNALGSTVKSNKLLKLLFILICKLRWKLKFFNWPIEFKLAKRMIVKA